MQPEHRIDELTIDLSFTTTSLARREKPGLSSWISEELLPALDHLFSQYSPSEQTLRFETLIFDLGNLDARNYQQQICEQLLEQFSRLLKPQLLALDRPRIDAGIEQEDTQVAAGIRQLFEYLTTGNIQAHRVSKRDNIHQQLLEQIVAQQNIAELLRQLPNREQLIERLLRQFNEPQRIELMRQLAPQQVPQIQTLLDLVQLAQVDAFNVSTSVSTSLNSLDTSKTFLREALGEKLRKKLWRQILSLGFDSPQATENNWLEQLLKNVSAESALDVSVLGKFLSSIQYSLSTATTSFQSPLAQLQKRILQVTGLQHREAQIYQTQNVLAQQGWVEVAEPGHALDQDSGRQLKQELSNLQLKAFYKENVDKDEDLQNEFYKEQYEALAPEISKKHPETPLVEKMTSLAVEHHNEQKAMLHEEQLVTPAVAPNIDQLQKQQQEISFQERPLQEKSVQEKPLQERSVQERSVQERPVQERPVQEKPVEQYEALLSEIHTPSPDRLIEQVDRNSINNSGHISGFNIDQNSDQNSGQKLGLNPDQHLAFTAAQHPVEAIELSDHFVHQEFGRKLGNEFHQDFQEIFQQRSKTELRQQIASALIRGDLLQLQTIWQPLLAHEPQLLLAALRHYLTQAELVQQATVKFPLDMQSDIIGLLDPGLKPIFSRLQQQAELFNDAISSHLQQLSTNSSSEHSDTQNNNLAETTDLINNSAEILQRRLWEIATIWLVNEAAQPDSAQSQCEPEEFLQQLIAGYAQLHSLDSQWLQQLAYSLIQPVPSGVRLPSAIEQSSNLELTAQGETPVTVELLSTSESDVNKYSGISAEAVFEQRRVAAETIREKTDAIDISTSRKTEVEPGVEGELQNEESLPRNPLTISSLVNVSDHQLFDLCLRLKSGAVTWMQLPADEHLLQRLIQSYIRLGHSATAENCADFVAAINYQAEQVQEPVIFYRAVLQALIADQLIDLEAIAAAVQNLARLELTESSTTDLLPTQKLSINSDSDSAVSWVATSASILPKDTKAIAQYLLNSKRNISTLPQLQLDIESWREVCIEIIQSEHAAELGAHQELLAAIDKYAQQAIDKSGYYRTVIAAFLQQQPLNLEDFSKAITAGEITSSAPAMTKQAITEETIIEEEVTKEKTVEAKIAEQTTADLNFVSDTAREKVVGIADTPVADLSGNNDVDSDSAKVSYYEDGHSENLANQDSASIAADCPIAETTKEGYQIAQLLRKGTQSLTRLKTLKLNPTQWQEVCVAIVQSEHAADLDSHKDLLTAIANYAQQAVDKNSYYRQLISAFLQQHPLNLEKFASVKNDTEALSSQQRTLPDSSHQELVTSTELSSADSLEHLSIDDEVVKNNSAALKKASANKTSQEIYRLAKSLVEGTQGLTRLETLKLHPIQWQDVCVAIVQSEHAADLDSNKDLLTAIANYAQQAADKNSYYRQLISAFLRQHPLDLEKFASVKNNTEGLSSQHITLSDSSSALKQISANKIPQEIYQLAQSLREGTQGLIRLEQLNLNPIQWQQVCVQLMEAQAETASDGPIELLSAIEKYARRSLNKSLYYRRVIRAFLQQQPIDLEIFSAIQDTKTHSMTSSEKSNRKQDDVSQSFSSDSTHSDDQLAALRSNLIQEKNSHAQKINDHIQELNDPAHEPKDSAPANHSTPFQKTQQTIDRSLLTGSDDLLRNSATSLATLLAADGALDRDQQLVLQQYVNRLLHQASPDVINEWSQLLSVKKHYQQLIHAVPAHLLHKIALRLHAANYELLDSIVKVASEALALLVADTNSLALKQAKWEFIFYVLFVDGTIIQDKTKLTRKLCDSLAQAAGIDDSQRLVNLTERRVALLKPPATKKPSMSLEELGINNSSDKGEDNPVWEAGIHIDNAGQILAAAFMPRLFAMLNLTQEGKFVHPGAADRAAHLVQFMVTGATATPEYDLVLNKVLCGISTSLPITAGIDITEQEQNVIEQMLSSMIQHWKVLGATSIAGLRETFFQRQGWLVLEEDCWRLKVQERTFDMLLDHLPWSIALIKHSWMDKPLRVSWRNQS
jgi:hypothetical protein